MVKHKKEVVSDAKEEIVKEIEEVEDKVVEPQVRPYVIPSSDAPQAITQENAAFLSSLKRIKVTPEELMKLQAEKRAVGYDPVTQEAIIK